MLLIATDEAGYGPKLGPLVIVATAWRLIDEDGQKPEDCFAPLREPTAVGDVTVVVDDSKSVFQPGQENPLAQLHAAVSVCNAWQQRDTLSFEAFLRLVTSRDFPSVLKTPWLTSLSGNDFLDSGVTKDALAAWSASAVACQDMRARIITAKAFNAACESGMNKADLLSESTLGLVRELAVSETSGDSPVEVYCDRHGGRRYYAGVLQHIFDDAAVQVVSEAKQQSVYLVRADDYEIKIHFTVKGDSFTPVAMSSMYAKYIRERMMESLNEFFGSRHRGSDPLRPTAGYPTDAARFLKQIQPIIEHEKIDPNDLVRNR